MKDNRSRFIELVYESNWQYIAPLCLNDFPTLSCMVFKTSQADVRDIHNLNAARKNH